MKYLKEMVLVSCFIISSTPAFAESNIEGTYTCSGTDVVSKVSFSNQLTISKQAENLYNFKWRHTTGEEYLGVGFAPANTKNQLVAAFKNRKDADEFGVAIYQIEKNGDFIGTFVKNGEKTMSSSTCKKAKE